MARKATLDAMIPREDFAIADEEFALDLFSDFPIHNLLSDNPVFKLLRKPDFQRETNHWNPEQIATFIASFVDNEVIPSLILWKSPSFIFVIDGGHRLSALRAFIEDDYGDGAQSLVFYRGAIPNHQKAVAKRTRQLIEQRVGRYSTLRALIDKKATDDPVAYKRANRLFTRALPLQWVQGTASVAETSFFKINSQGTPLDDTEEMLIKNRRKAIAISARAILRAGTGHTYWSSFQETVKTNIESLAADIYLLLFEPEAEPPLKTLDIPLGGTVSPVDALSLLIEFLTISGSATKEVLAIEKYPPDEDGSQTVNLMKRSLKILNRITGNSPGSLGLHPAIYFYNERGKYSRFLFLGMISLITDKIRDNDDQFFKRFIKARGRLEQFLIDNKSLIGIALQNMSKAQRVPKMKELFELLINSVMKNQVVTPESAMEQIGIRGRIFDLKAAQNSTLFSDDTKTMAFVSAALSRALKCEICDGLLDPKKSVSYDHITPIRDGGTGELGNARLVHPFCNTGIKG